MNDNLAHKHALYSEVGRLSRALGQQTRLEIIEILAQAPRNVEALADILRTDIKSISQHLKVLEQSRLVTVERRGRFRWYAVAGREVLQLAVMLRKTAQKIAQSRLPAANARSLELETALKLSRLGKLQLLDVRPEEEFAAGHLPNALNIPLEHIESELKLLKSGIPTAAYCRSPFCFLARQAAEILARHGIELMVIDSGVLDWKACEPELFEKPFSNGDGS